MKFTYKKLWKLLIDKDMKKTELINLAQISKSSVTKLVHDENVTTDVLLKICVALDCEISDIMEIVKE
ncbi:XRE family transcriptional regulator [Clostridium sp. OF09-36]|uniref:helix-turn-helix domain-containing protein n=1 Tax=Clostridium sp. OF09-36 TaxID=2292310 RepID=UPI000E490E72|nr:helix-turn-helix transcriptional regulator [Clostridium sp. OF09-36]RHV85809.1 XRE family transcriptional regulator [Clostridium sp. OF09-36]